MIPFYQREPGILRKAVESVLLQADVDNVQIIIVDDGSPVSPREELRDLIEKDDGRIRLLVQENAGPGAAPSKWSKKDVPAVRRNAPSP